MSSSPRPPPPLDFCGVLSESKRIITAHSRHFLALSVLFLLPISFSTTFYSTLHHLLLSSSHFPPSQALLRHPLHIHHHHHHHNTNNNPNNPISAATLLLPLVYTLLLLLLSISAVGSITYSVVHSFYGRPVKLFPAIFSLLRSFFPLFITSLTSYLIQFFLVSCFALLLFSIIKGSDFLGLHIDRSSPYFIGFCLFVSVCILFMLLYLQLNWALASVVVVAESSWGYEPLKRSAYLVKGLRGVALCLLLFFGFFIGVLAWSSSLSTEGFDGATSGLKDWAFVLQTVVTTMLVMLLMLHSVAANTVLYMYCKAINGELALEIAEEFACEYVSLPFDDEKVPHLVSVMPT